MGRSRGLNILTVIVLLTVIHWVDARTGSAPFQHLYYIPIVFAAITVPPFGGVVAAVAAVVLYHTGNPRLLTFMYAEADVVQIALFLAIGIVTARLADDARRLRHMSESDDLTGLFNLRGFERRLADAMASARRQDGPLAMLVLDVDRLKSLNDTHGHHTGADAVRHVGAIIGQCLPAGAFACRFGGDEFVVSLPGSSAGTARDVASTIREKVSGTAPTLAGGPVSGANAIRECRRRQPIHAASAPANGVDRRRRPVPRGPSAAYVAKARPQPGQRRILTVGSVRRRAFDAIDDECVDDPSIRFQLETELFLDRRED